MTGLVIGARENAAFDWRDPMSAFASRHRLPILIMAAFFVAAPKPAQAQLLDVTAILDTLLDLDTRVTLLGGELVTVNARLDADAAALAGISVDLDVLSGRVDGHDLTLIDHADRLAAHATQITANAGAIVAIDARVDAHDVRLADIDVALADNNVRIGANTAAIAALDTRMTSNDRRDDGQDAALAANSARDDGQDAAIAANNLRDDGQDSAIAANATAIAANDARDDGQDVRIGANSDAITDLDGRLSGQASAISQNTALIGQAAETAALARADGAAIRGELAAGTIGLVQQQGPNAAVTVAASTGGNAVSFAGTAGNRRLTGVAAGQAGSDAANVAQMQAGDAATLASANAYTDSSIAQLMDRVGEGASMLIAENNAVLRKDMNAIAAGTSALAGLPQSFMPGRGMMGAAIGGKGEEVAFAMGLSKAFDSEHAPVLRAGAAIDARRGTVSYNASVGFHF
ncbi:YadA C-terminal domain-containing protein [Sphingomonas gilva]|uniref:YadA C-terminal domain-containing protein n=1 Tax=Sphingomonas gilva TaxID=2305907 RepID=UPI001CA40589|nr:YadA C-terminal domain-containing protein [Sphingomonas gilva]